VEVRRTLNAWGLAAALVLAGAARLAADELHVDKAAANRVGFTARFLGETFDGATSKIDGYAFWKGTDPESGAPQGSALYFEVDLNALDTGIGLRNRHMQDDYLKTDQFPYAAFKGTVTKTVRQGPADTLVAVEGKLSLHGREQALAVTGRVTVDGERYRLTCAFPLDIRDYAIQVPSLMGAKVDPVLSMSMDVTLVRVK
jgi:polyisoprenoid-binding protein YceI